MVDLPLCLGLATGRALVGIWSLELCAGSGNVEVGKGIMAWMAKSSVLKEGFGFAWFSAGLRGVFSYCERCG